MQRHDCTVQKHGEEEQILRIFFWNNNHIQRFCGRLSGLLFISGLTLPFSVLGNGYKVHKPTLNC